MSSILASLDMSLDDLIARKKTKITNPASRPAKAHQAKDVAGPIRSGNRRNRGRSKPYSRSRGENDDDMDIDRNDVPEGGNSLRGKKRSVIVKKPGKAAGKGGSSILSRLGGRDAANPGTKILVKNLKFDILEEEVRELFGTVGDVSKAEIVYDRSGRSKGIARVWFTRRSDADKAIKQYDGRTLDGQPMQILLDSDKNVRDGLFGTALQRGDKDVKFKVSFGGDNEQAKGRRRRRGRGNDKGSHGVRGRESSLPKSAEDLDNEMDTYMKDA